MTVNLKHIKSVQCFIRKKLEKLVNFSILDKNQPSGIFWSTTRSKPDTRQQTVGEYYYIVSLTPENFILTRTLYN